MRFLQWLVDLTSHLVPRRRRKSLLHMPERLESRALLSAIVVTSTQDAPDANPGDGLAQTASGETTLRAAIQEANASPGPDTIFLPAGVFDLTLVGTDNTAAAGDLDITDALTIVGAGSDQTVIDASGIDQAFHLLDGATLNLDSLSITTNADAQPVLIEDGTLETHEVTTESADEDIAPGTDSTLLPAINLSAVTVSPRQSEFLVALYQSRPAARDESVLFDQRPIIVDQLASLDAMNTLGDAPNIIPLPGYPADTSEPKSPEQTPDRDRRPEVLATQEAVESPTEETPGQKRQGVINSLFQNRPDGPASVRQVSGENAEQIEAEQTRDALPMLLPMKKDGDLQLVPDNPQQDRPAPPPLPEPKFINEFSSRATPGSQILVAGALMTVVRPTAWKRTLRRISKWSRLVV